METKDQNNETPGEDRGELKGVLRRLTSMNVLYLTRIWSILKEHRRAAAAKIDRPSVIGKIKKEIEITPGYYFILTLANLIALSGLIVNSAPVIIGAMLISPLMGPILSFGVSFATGDRDIWRGSIKNLAISVSLTIIIAAVMSMISPSKEITQEILARTRPNLYDLIIAFLSGTAGAVAFCTKRNYLTIVPGVAIATAVIPPLSVTGFGLGTGEFGVMTGGFFLFFTNFVSITIATAAVFYLYGFAPTFETLQETTALRRRFMYLAVVMIIISIPLIYTLQKSVSEVRLKNSVSAVLSKSFNKEKTSHLVSFEIKKTREGRVDVDATVNTVDYISETEIAVIEERLRMTLGRDVRLYVEEVMVKPGGLREGAGAEAFGAADKPAQPAVKAVEISARDAGAALSSLIGGDIMKMQSMIEPAMILDYHVGYSSVSQTALVRIKIKSDDPAAAHVRRWMDQALTARLGMPVEIHMETVPMVPLITFKNNSTRLDAEAVASLADAAGAYKKYPKTKILIESFTPATMGFVKREALSKERAQAVINAFRESYGMPQGAFIVIIRREARGADETASAKVRVFAASAKGLDLSGGGD